MGSEKGDVLSLDINPRILDGVRKAKLRSPIQVLTLSTNELARLTRLTAGDARLLQEDVARGLLAPPPATALEMFTGRCRDDLRRRHLSTGCSVIDGLLKEGVVSGALTEISGESAVGKTQLCLQMCLTVQLTKEWGGLHGGAAYVSTEDAFPVGRLVDMSDRLRRKFPEFEGIRFTDDVFVEKASDYAELKFCLKRKIPHLVREKNVKLVVVDSVAGVMRAEGLDIAGPAERSRRLCSIAGYLRRVATDHNIPVVLINQVTEDASNCSLVGGTERKTLPALGLMWANLMNVRIFLSRTSEYVTRTRHLASGQREPVEVNVRTMQVLSAPHLPNVSCRFVVDEEGVKGL